MPLIHVLNGPNLNLLGQRQPEIYGRDTLADIEALCAAAADPHRIRFLQTNWEGQMIDWIHEARTEAAGIVINPAALGHSSIALLDALNTFDGPVIEVHLSQIHRREAFRHHSYVSHRADAVIAGMGIHGYAAGLAHAVRLIG